MPKPSSAVSSVATEEANGDQLGREDEVAMDARGAPGGRRFDCRGTVVGLEPVGLDGRAIDGQPGVVDEHADPSCDPQVDGVGDVADLDVDRLAGVGRQVEGGVDPPARFAGECVPGTRGAGRRTGAARRQVMTQGRVEPQEEVLAQPLGGLDDVRPLRSRSVVHWSVPDGAASTITWWNVSRVLNDSFICRVGAAVAGTPMRSTVRPMRLYDTGAFSACRHTATPRPGRTG